MFSENNRISGRQVFRLLTYDLLGLSTLLVPPFLGRVAGRDGIFCIAAGLLAALFYLKLIGVLAEDMTGSFSDYLEQRLGKICGKVLEAGYLIYFALLGGYTAYLFVDVVLEELLREESFYLVLILILALAAYGLWGGIEGRARVYEMLFWFLMAPLFLMLLSSMDEIQVDYWTPVFTADVSGVLIGSYYVFLCFSLVFLIFFLSGYVQKKRTLLAAGKSALIFVGVLHAVLYLVLLGIFGANALGEMDYPAVTLMSTVRISGGFLKRADAFIFAVWFFTLYALLNSCIFYGGKLLAALSGSLWKQSEAAVRERYAGLIILAPVCAAACCFYRNRVLLEQYEGFLWYIGTPFLVLVPLVLAAVKLFSDKKLRSRAGRAAALLAITCLSGSILSGCTTAELEDRNFPIELAVDDPDHFAQSFLEAEGAGSRVIDYSHLKVLILSRMFVEDAQAMEELLDFLEEKKELPRSTYLVVTEDVRELMGLSDALGESIGNYLEEQFENVSQINKQAYPTLGTLCREQANRMETLFIPIVSVAEEMPVIGEYFVWRRGEPVGAVDSGTALLSYFSENEMKEYSLSLEDGTVVTLFSPHNEVRFVDVTSEREIVVEVRCSGELGSYKAVGQDVTKSGVEREIEAYMNKLAETAMNEGRIDLSGSYRKLGSGSRDWYAEYVQGDAQYEEEMAIVYRVEINWVNL